MKPLFQTLLQIILVISIAFSAAAVESAKEAVIVVEHWPPWEIAHDAEKKNVTDGFAVDIVKTLFKRHGIGIKFVTAPWKRALRKIETGEADVITMISKTPEREAYMLFTVPVYEDKRFFLYSRDKFQKFEWENWEDLKPFRIGTVRGYDYGDFDDAAKKYQFQTEVMPTDKQNILKLMDGKIDITPLYYVNALAVLKNIPHNGKLVFDDKMVQIKVLRLGISKKSFLAKELDAISKTLQEMKTDGTFKKILGEFYME